MDRVNNKWQTQNLVKIAVLGVVSFIIMFFKVPLWFAPPFLKMDISDLPSLIGAFAISPATGAWVQLIKNVLNLVIEGTTTNATGELSNFLVGSVFAVVAGFIYHKNKTFKNALFGLVIGIVVMTLFAVLNNYYVMFPVYAKVFGMEIDTIVSMGSAVNKHVVDYKTLMLYAIVPFNLFKGIITALATVMVYKRVSPVLHK